MIGPSYLIGHVPTPTGENVTANGLQKRDISYQHRYPIHTSTLQCVQVMPLFKGGRFLLQMEWSPDIPTTTERHTTTSTTPATRRTTTSSPRPSTPVRLRTTTTSKIVNLAQLAVTRPPSKVPFKPFNTTAFLNRRPKLSNDFVNTPKQQTQRPSKVHEVKVLPPAGFLTK